MVTFALALVTTGCWSEDARAPTHLTDGSRAHVSSIPFEGIDVPVVMTSARSGRGAARTCQEQRPSTLRVDRVGAEGASSTIVSSDRRWAWACDATPTNRDCGRGFGRIGEHGVVDPRLSLTCRGAEDGPLAFMWLQPSPSTAYVVVEHAGYAEAYPTIGSIPVRVTTDDVDVETSSATARYSEHTRSGQRLRAATRVAQVSD